MSTETIDAETKDTETAELTADLPVNLTLPAETSKELNISADAVATEMNKLVDAGDITIGDKSLVLWFFGLAKERGLSCSEAAKLIHYNNSTLTRLFRGKYEGNLSNVISAIRAYKQLTEERAKMTKDEFLETSIWRSIRDTCDLAVMRQSPARIVGVSQIGKTAALLEYKRRSTYLVRYCRLPAAPTFRGVVTSVANACAVSAGCSTDKLRQRVIRSLDANTLLIIDELHELAISSGQGVAMKVMEWLRELYDVSGCGLIVCGTRTMEDDLICGNLKGWLEQFDQRCIRVLDLPSRLPDEDIMLCARAYGLPKPDDDTFDFLRTLRMRRLCVTLNLSADLATRRDQPRSWKLFLQAYKTVFGGAI